METKRTEKFIEREIAEEMQSAYLDYAMSVIVSRALPDVRDGLKPVQRRILYSMYEDGLRSDGKFKKAASVVGSTLAKYHPHGDQAVYDAAIRMAQDFTLRYPLIQGQGNIGSIDDPGEYAAMRYVEMKLSKIGEEMLKDIEKETVDFMENYDGTKKEPVVLPSPIPQLLINGTVGIAVGMATSIPPHNLCEICDALIYLIDHPEASIEEIFEFVQGPDFPTGGIIFDKKSIIRAYAQGRGPILVRAKSQIVEGEGGKKKILISEIPFQVQKSALLEQLANLVLEKKIEGIKDIRDESDKEGLRIVIDLEKNANPQLVLNLLFKLSDLQKIFHLNFVALVDGIQPKTLSLIDALNHFLNYRKEVVLRRTRFDLRKAKERIHILEGIDKCLANIEKTISIIKTSREKKEAKERLMKAFSIDGIQAEAILEIKLASLVRLEREKVFQELKTLLEREKELERILKTPRLVKEILKKEFEELKVRFGDKRRTLLVDEEIKEVKEEDLVAPEETVLIFSKKGFVKRVDPKEYKIQRRGKKGILGMKIEKEDQVSKFFFTNTKEKVFVFTQSGKVFPLFVYEIPKEKRESKGKPISNFLAIPEEEKILTLISLKPEKKFFIFGTKLGLIKKTPVSEFQTLRKTGSFAIKLKKGDELRDVSLTDGKDEILLATKRGKVIRFYEKEIREMGKNAGGVRGIKLEKGDELVDVEVLKKGEEKFILSLTKNGFGKRTKSEEYKLQKRGGKGILGIKIDQKRGDLVRVIPLKSEEELFLISESGKIMRIEIRQIPVFSRFSKGVRIMKIEGDKIASAFCI